MSCFSALTHTVQSQIDRIRNAFKQRREASSTAAVKRQQIGLPRSVVKDEDPFGSMMSLNQGGDKAILLQEKARAEAIAAARKAGSGGGGGGGFGHHPPPPPPVFSHPPTNTTFANSNTTTTAASGGEDYKASRTSSTSTSTKVGGVEETTADADTAAKLEDVAFR